MVESPASTLTNSMLSEITIALLDKLRKDPDHLSGKFYSKVTQDATMYKNNIRRCLGYLFITNAWKLIIDDNSRKLRKSNSFSSFIGQFYSFMNHIGKLDLVQEMRNDLDKYWTKREYDAELWNKNTDFSRIEYNFFFGYTDNPQKEMMTFLLIFTINQFTKLLEKDIDSQERIYRCLSAEDRFIANGWSGYAELSPSGEFRVVRNSRNADNNISRQNQRLDNTISESTKSVSDRNADYFMTWFKRSIDPSTFQRSDLTNFIEHYAVTNQNSNGREIHLICARNRDRNPSDLSVSFLCLFPSQDSVLTFHHYHVTDGNGRRTSNGLAFPLERGLYLVGGLESRPFGDLGNATTPPSADRIADRRIQALKVIVIEWQSIQDAAQEPVMSGLVLSTGPKSPLVGRLAIWPTKIRHSELVGIGTKAFDDILPWLTQVDVAERYDVPVTQAHLHSEFQNISVQRKQYLKHLEDRIRFASDSAPNALQIVSTEVITGLPPSNLATFERQFMRLVRRDAATQQYQSLRVSPLTWD